MGLGRVLFSRSSSLFRKYPLGTLCVPASAHALEVHLKNCAH